MNCKEFAYNHMKEHGHKHIIYGYRAKGEDCLTGLPRDMKKFDDDDSFCSYIDKMQIQIDGLEHIYAVHA